MDAPGQRLSIRGLRLTLFWNSIVFTLYNGNGTSSNHLCLSIPPESTKITLIHFAEVSHVQVATL